MALSSMSLTAVLLASLAHHDVSAFPIHQITRQRVHSSTAAATTTTRLPSTKEKIQQYGSGAPYDEANYDPHAAADFYKDRPVESISRLTQIATKSVGFIADTVIDSKLNREEQMVDQRSDELLELVSGLGPTFIKVSWCKPHHIHYVNDNTCCVCDWFSQHIHMIDLFI